jgi:hypothetical protein
MFTFVLQSASAKTFTHQLIIGLIAFCLLSDLGQAQIDDNAETRWRQPSPQDTSEVTKKKPKKAPARVRIGLRLTPFRKMVTGEKRKTKTQFVPDKTLRHTLRARLNKVNHFFVGDFHVETRPQSWVKQSRRYSILLTVYRRYGSFGQLEENIGNIELSGVLEEQDQNVFILYGSSAKRMRDKFGNPVLDLVAGYRPGETTKARSKQATAHYKRPVPPKLPPTATGSKIRGRF